MPVDRSTHDQVVDPAAAPVASDAPPPPIDEHPQRKPVIGITAGEASASYGVWKERAALLPVDYLQAIVRAGGLPVILAPVPDAAEELVERLDGLLLSGGQDLDSARFGQQRHPKAQNPDGARDAFEIALLKAAATRDMPVLAICRGIQVVNVWRGGTLHQHLPDVVANTGHLRVPGVYGRHRVQICPTSQLGSIVGRLESQVPTHHHQAPDRIGEGLVASAWADDGTIEGLEDPTSRYLIAVQWHPEVGDDPSLFESLIAASRPAETFGAPCTDPRSAIHPG